MRGDRIAPQEQEKFAAAPFPAAFLQGWTLVLARSPWSRGEGVFCSATARLGALLWEDQ